MNRINAALSLSLSLLPMLMWQSDRRRRQKRERGGKEECLIVRSSPPQTHVPEKQRQASPFFGRVKIESPVAAITCRREERGEKRSCRCIDHWRDFFWGKYPIWGKRWLIGERSSFCDFGSWAALQNGFFLGFFRSQAPHVVSHTPMSISSAFLSFLFTRSFVSGFLSLIYQDANELSHYFRNFMRELISFVLAPLFSLGEWRLAF